ncbi:MAG: thiamine phosphate synthase [Deltaproteobacteria bacterium]|nr:MAG: thiamine phosphate synthase [Deltaproteobacteria bacterium]
MIDFSLYLITDRSQVANGHTLYAAVEAALQGGVKAVQLREKDLSPEALLRLAKELRTLTMSHGALLFINDNVDIALAVNADGVHLGEHSEATEIIRAKVGGEMLIGVSTHSKEEIERAAKQGADFVTFGPVYATPSKAKYGKPQGLEKLSEACRNSSIPVFALGGITSERVTEVQQAGASGIALISAIIASSDPCLSAATFTTCS